MCKRTRIASFLFSSILIFCCSIPHLLKAQTIASSTDDISRQAEVIAIAKVAGLSAEWNEAHTMIRTRVTLNVDQYVKGGTAGNALTLYVPGGEVDGVGEVYSDMPRFKADEEVFVFAKKDTRGLYRIAGGEQGKYTIQRDAVTGKLSVAGNKPLDDFAASVRKALQVQSLK